MCFSDQTVLCLLIPRSDWRTMQNTPNSLDNCLGESQMKKLPLALVLLCLLGTPAAAQLREDIRNPSINTESEEGSLINQAILSEDPVEKAKLLETFVEKYGEHEQIGYVYLQLQGLYVEQKNFPRVLEYGKKLVAIAPDLIEARDNMTLALYGTQDWEALLPHMLETKPIADKTAATPEPEYEDEMPMWEAVTGAGNAANRNIEYHLYASAFSLTDAAQKVAYLDALIEHFPESQYAKLTPPLYVSAYQQLGDFEKTIHYMELALESDPNNESYLYNLADSSVRKGGLAKAREYADRVLQVLAEKPKPDNVAEEDWAKHKELFTALSKYTLGRVLVVEGGADLDKFRESRVLLREAEGPLKAQGGAAYGELAYYMGVCYVKLDIEGDNIRAATNWMSIAAEVPNPYQQQAQATLAKIRESQ